MSTRASIRFKDDWGDEFFVYRHSDGFPENIVPDIEAAIAKAEGRWSGAEMGTFVTLFLAMHYDSDKFRLPDYELTHAVHGDESNRFEVAYSRDEKKWKITKWG